ncbi:MAG: hypothetical protein K8I29_14035 [Alphaproteobacteria bacterium]|uniref:Uncharacterized protein n=1 Tax=Candidatus Nitrobium versatile TaxID=2884831 RepID=A0A953JEV4_9BACT|nr:hypothetical protein [Candidatus Nitrobium versatile]
MMKTVCWEGKNEVPPDAPRTHRMDLDDAPYGYELFKDKEDGCIKVVLKP